MNDLDEQLLRDIVANWSPTMTAYVIAAALLLCAFALRWQARRVLRRQPIIFDGDGPELNATLLRTMSDVCTTGFVACVVAILFFEGGPLRWW